MIIPEHKLPFTKQANALGISRGSVYYLPRPVSDRDQALMKRIDRLYAASPFAGVRDEFYRIGFLSRWIPVVVYMHSKKQSINTASPGS